MLLSTNLRQGYQDIETFLVKTIKDLGIKNGQFKVSIEPQVDLNEWGKDRIRFLFSRTKRFGSQVLTKSDYDTARLEKKFIQTHSRFGKKFEF